MTDQVPEGEAIRGRPANILPAVPRLRGCIVVNPRGEEIVGPATVGPGEDGEREVVRVDVLDVIEGRAEGAFARPRNPDLLLDQPEDVGAVGRMVLVRAEHVADLVGDQAIEQSRFDRPDRHEERVPIREGLRGAHDRDGDDLGGDRPLQGMAQLGIPALDGFEGRLYLPRSSATGLVDDGDEHGSTSRRRAIKVGAGSEGGRTRSKSLWDLPILIVQIGFSGVRMVATKKRSDRKEVKTPTPDEVEENLRRANLPTEQSAKYHPYYQGKIEIVPRVPVRTFNDFAIWYTPGVAQPCLDIKADPNKVWTLTNKWNQIAIVTDGTRVLGLGDIGPEAGLPVMEGKALLFKYLGGVDAFPVPLATKDPEKIIETVKLITPSFGGVNLEDIAQPKCFGILERLRKECDIAVWHDDQQGTATINVAGVINALKVVGKEMPEVQITLIGAGASNIRTAKILITAGAKPANLILVDSKGIVGRHRKDVEAARGEFAEKWELAQMTNGESRVGGIAEAMEGVDVVIAASKPGPGVIQKEWVASMADDAILFVIANPVPEIWPWEAAEAGARIIATGRSDFPNQVNNSLGFPGIFRGTLDVRAKTITDEMCIAAAEELAKVAEEKGLDETHIVPTMDEIDVFAREATAVALKAMEQGIAREAKTRDALYQGALEMIRRAREETKSLMQDGFIRPPPP